MLRQRLKRDPATPRISPTHRVLAMQLQIGDQYSDETGDWEVIGRPHTLKAGKIAYARVRLIARPTVTTFREWDAEETVDTPVPPALCSGTVVPGNAPARRPGKGKPIFGELMKAYCEAAGTGVRIPKWATSKKLRTLPAISGGSDAPGFNESGVNDMAPHTPQRPEASRRSRGAPRVRGRGGRVAGCGGDTFTWLSRQA